MPKPQKTLEKLEFLSSILDFSFLFLFSHISHFSLDSFWGQDTISNSFSLSSACTSWYTGCYLAFVPIRLIIIVIRLYFEHAPFKNRLGRPNSPTLIHRRSLLPRVWCCKTFPVKLLLWIYNDASGLSADLSYPLHANIIIVSRLPFTNLGRHSRMA